MMKILFLIFLTPLSLLAEGPRFKHKDTVTQQEFENAYQDIRTQKSEKLSVSSATSNFVPYSGASKDVYLGTNRLFVSSNTGSTPGVAFWPDTDTGIGSDTEGFTVFYANGNESGWFGIVDSTRIVGTEGSFWAKGGSLGFPSYTFSSQQNAGMYLVGSNTLGLQTAGTKVWEADVSGYITRPWQPSVLALQGTSASDVTGDGTGYTCALDTEIFDRSANFNTGTYTFTAPKSGVYRISAKIRADQINTSHTPIRLEIVTSNRTIPHVFGGVSNFTTIDLSNSILTDMDANDTATIQLRVDASSKVIDVSGNGSVPVTYLSVDLVN